MCRTEGDVKRALNAWGAYGRSSERPIDAFNKGLPRKHTLHDLWAKPASKAGKTATAAPRPGGFGAETRQSAAAVPRPGEQAGTGRAAAQLPLPAPSVDLKGTTRDDSKQAGSSRQGGPQAKGSQAPANAFSVLLSSAKASACTPPKQPAPRPPASRQPGFGGWQDILHQIVMQPER